MKVTTEFSKEEFVEIIQGKYGIELKVVRENSSFTVPVTIEILIAIDKTIDKFAALLSAQERLKRKNTRTCM